MTLDEIIAYLEERSNPEAIAGMARYGIAVNATLGVPIPELRKLAKRLGQDHALAEELWAAGMRETRILASMVEPPGMLTAECMERWAADFDSWEVCDQCCNNLFKKVAAAPEKAVEWSGRPEEFVKRAGFVLMAVLAVSEKRADDDYFERFFPLIEREACDQRNYVKKAVNWALRQIGKRNVTLHARAVEVAEALQEMECRAARWNAADALRELGSEAVLRRLGITKPDKDPIGKESGEAR